MFNFEQFVKPYQSLCCYNFEINDTVPETGTNMWENIVTLSILINAFLRHSKYRLIEI